MIRFSSRRFLWGFIPPAKIYVLSLSLSLSLCLPMGEEVWIILVRRWRTWRTSERSVFPPGGGRNTSSRAETKEKSPEDKKRLDSKNCLPLFWSFQRNCCCWKISVRPFCKNSVSGARQRKLLERATIFLFFIFFFFLLSFHSRFLFRFKSIDSTLLHFF